LSDNTPAIVTGSGRGIGKQTAILLSKIGLNLVGCSRTQGNFVLGAGWY